MISLSVAALALASCRTTSTQLEPATGATVVTADTQQLNAAKVRGSLMPEEVARRIVDKYSFPADKSTRKSNRAVAGWAESPYFERTSARGKMCSRVSGGAIADIDGVTLFKTAKPTVGYTAVTAHRHDDAKCGAGVTFTAQTEEEADELFAALRALGAHADTLKIVISQ